MTNFHSSATLSYSPLARVAPLTEVPELVRTTPYRQKKKEKKGLLLILASLCCCLALSILLVDSFKGTSVTSFAKEHTFKSYYEPKLFDARISLARTKHARELELRNQFTFLNQVIHQVRKNPREAHDLARAIVAVSKRNGYDPLFVTSVIFSESTFNRFARSHAGAQGLMQIMPETGRYISNKKQLTWHGSEKLHEVNYNIELGISYLNYLKDKFNSPELVLIAYNWGPENLNRALRGEKRIPQSSLHYAKSIIKRHLRWSNDYRTKLAKAGNRLDDLKSYS